MSQLHMPEKMSSRRHTALLQSLPQELSLRGTHSQEAVSRSLGTTWFFRP